MLSSDHSLPYLVENAIEDVKRILDETRSPKFFADVDHSYEDKYALAEYVVNVGLASQLNCLEMALGLDSKKNKQLMELSQQGKRSVTLRFTAQETCSFLCEKEVELQGGINIKREVKTSDGDNTSETKIVTTSMDYHWKIDTKYSIIAFIGSDPTEAFVALTEGQFGGEVVKRGVKKAPRPEITHSKPIDVGIAQMFQLLKCGDRPATATTCNFVIDREATACRTPWNNEDVEGVQTFIRKMKMWSVKVSEFFFCYARSLPHRAEANPLPPDQRLSKEVQDANSQMFNPVLPFFDSNSKTEDGAGGNDSDAPMQQELDGLAHILGESSCFKAPVLTADDTAALLREHRRSLSEVHASLKATTEIETMGANEVFLCATLKQLKTLGECIWKGVFSIEENLREQLIAAVGKHIEAKDFAEYMRFHNRRLLKPEYAPTPFCYSVRRPEHYPEGTLSILSSNNNGGSGNDSAFDTLSRKLDMGDGTSMMHLPINSATTVQVGGDRYVHAILAHEFSNDESCRNQSNSPIQLVARARQFSCFMLVLGTVTGPDTFDPSSAIILQNKDEIIIPLLLEQMPSPKEFKDAIQSLSPEQQRFAKAFRNMQLSSSVFGVMIIQLKPQLEKLLKLPADALTKEVKLTQSLLELFMEYQIPSDLLTYDQDHQADADFVNVDVSATEKVKVVQGYAKGVEDMISDAKKKTIADEESKAEMRKQQQQHLPAVGDGTTKHRLQAQSRRMHRAMGNSGMQMMAMQMAPSETFVSTRVSSAASSAAPASVLDDQDAMGVDSMAPTLASTSPGTTAQEPIYSDKNAQPSPSDTSTAMMDFSLLPKTLDARFEEFDEDSALRPTKVKSGPVWTKNFRKNILSKEESSKLGSEQQQHEKNKAFDLLDALSRSGSLGIDCAELHIMVAATHCFDSSLIDSVIHDNINPIEKFERSVLIVTSVLHGDDKTPADLIATPQEAHRVMALSPTLLLNDSTSTVSAQPPAV